ncbi:hypothetical protein EGT74_08890 [Chitinophaga lutea]|uniref:DUF922 domain-containing protein n=1 Tax=Chitinophaga lutea TaxID=2488634 RepID=A0A3N4PY15_9BACT|nr:hypothetical protein [Chitinophaga lutea]RPE13612.1 hypothetical protein EGT74_08890 [Chitinophaga lutea]
MHADDRGSTTERKLTGNPSPAPGARHFGYSPQGKSSLEIIKIIFVEDARPEDENSDTLFYHQRPVQARDYRGAPRPGSRNEAVSFTSFAFDGSSRRFRDTLEITLILQVFWVKSASWSRTMPPSQHTLEHEQIHFDITRLVAERFRKKIMRLPLTMDDHDSRIQFEYLESFREMNRMQEAYDDEVHSGQNAARQLEWRRKIRQELIGEGVKPADGRI